MLPHRVVARDKSSVKSMVHISAESMLMISDEERRIFKLLKNKYRKRSSGCFFRNDISFGKTSNDCLFLKRIFAQS